MGINNNKIELRPLLVFSFQILMCLIVCLSIPSVTSSIIGDLFSFNVSANEDDIDIEEGNYENIDQNSTKFFTPHGEGKLIVSNYQVTPKVLMPNTEGVISVDIENPGSGSVKISKVTINSKDIILLNENYSYTGILEAGSKISVKFKFNAPSKVGLYFPEVQIDAYDTNSKAVRMIKHPILVNVNTDISTIKDPVIEVGNVIPESINPGDRFKVKLILTNKGSGKANNISIQILPGPLVPISIINLKNFEIENIEPQKTYEFYAEFFSKENTKFGLYSIPINIKYYDENGILKQQTEHLQVKIKGEADLIVSSIIHNPSKVEEEDFVTLVIKIKNKGTGDAKSVKANVDLPFNGTTSVFLGDIGPGKIVPAEFTFKADDAGTYLYTITVNYESDGKVGKITPCSKITVNKISKDQWFSIGRLLSMLFSR